MQFWRLALWPWHSSPELICPKLQINAEGLHFSALVLISSHTDFSKLPQNTHKNFEPWTLKPSYNESTAGADASVRGGTEAIPHEANLSLQYLHLLC